MVTEIRYISWWSVLSKNLEKNSIRTNNVPLFLIYTSDCSTRYKWGKIRTTEKDNKQHIYL